MLERRDSVVKLQVGLDLAVAIVRDEPTAACVRVEQLVRVQ